jgi:hypothetical protein
MKFLAAILVTIGLARADNLAACTATGLVAQEEQSNCLVAAEGAQQVITTSFLNDPTFVNSPLSQTSTIIKPPSRRFSTAAPPSTSRHFSRRSTPSPFRTRSPSPTRFLVVTAPHSAHLSRPRTPQLWYRA